MKIKKSVPCGLGAPWLMPTSGREHHGQPTTVLSLSQIMIEVKALVKKFL